MSLESSENSTSSLKYIPFNIDLLKTLLEACNCIQLYS